eukprot:TRINITY_DN61281_c0_g1_i1.p1 TRINITY_DN61281_c0_g1~~TRINITY_DN61281_c0_g1_i1.p1  ORF type:complete len:425 (-),score=53.04 TRINITY_DN61281_c0_g1_i1:149-1372(-)
MDGPSWGSPPRAGTTQSGQTTVRPIKRHSVVVSRAPSTTIRHMSPTVRQVTPPTLVHQSPSRNKVASSSSQLSRSRTRPTPFSHLPRRLLLTCSGLTQPKFYSALAALLRARKPSGDPKVLYVPDAGIGNGFDLRSLSNSVRGQLAKLGVVRVACVELRHTSPQALAQQLEGVDCLFVDAGNTFYLRYYMHTSGFDQLVPPLVCKQGVVFVGVSSGSIVAGNSIATALWKGWDDPGHGKEWDVSTIGYDGLNLMSNGASFFPHYAPRYANLVQLRRKELNHEVISVDDDHAYVEGLPPDNGSLVAVTARLASVPPVVTRMASATRCGHTSPSPTRMPRSPSSMASSPSRGRFGFPTALGSPAPQSPPHTMTRGLSYTLRTPPSPMVRSAVQFSPMHVHIMHQGVVAC